MRSLAHARGAARAHAAFAACSGVLLAWLVSGCSGTVQVRTVEAVEGDAAHAEVFERAAGFPSAVECKECHPKHYDEWSVSQHAYAQVSPVFNAMHATLLEQTSGTLGDFCIRCHTPIGMQIGEPLVASNLDRAPVSVEGVTCVVCHRMNANYGKNSARSLIGIGSIVDPIQGPTNGEELARRLADPTFPSMSTEVGVPASLPVHGRIEPFFALTTPGFCGSCHDVTLLNGFRLEEAFSEYKTSPAAARGESCQDCHMGTTPGAAEGYPHGPAAVVKGRETAPRRLSNHLMIGPDYPVVHPAIFPHNPKRDEIEGVTIRDWLAFDPLAGWGTSEWERGEGKGFDYPGPWDDRGLRRKAARFLEEQVERLRAADVQRRQLLRQGYRLEAVEVESADEDGIELAVEVASGTDGHNVPTGFTAERLVFLRVTVLDREGTVVFRSGDLDPNGDLRDRHSLYVQQGLVPEDPFLFSLQSKFVLRNNRGSERDRVLSVNQSIDPLPYVRPDTRSNILTGRTLGARIQKVGIEPLGHRRVAYRVDGDQLTGKGPYAAQVDLVAAMVPVNLVHAIQGAGFDYGMSPRAIADAIVNGIGPPDEEGRRVGGHQTLWSRRVEIAVEGGSE